MTKTPMKKTVMCKLFLTSPFHGNTEQKYIFRETQEVDDIIGDGQCCGRIPYVFGRTGTGWLAAQDAMRNEPSELMMAAGGV